MRSCVLCRDPVLREACGLHQVRHVPEAEVTTTWSWSGVEGSDLQLRGCANGRTLTRGELPVPFTGFWLLEDVVDEREEDELLREIGRWPWRPSQSGRQKQDFGPKANFKKQRLKLGDARGLPQYAHVLLDRLRSRCVDLVDFEPAEFLTLSYRRELQSNHDLHVDDTWLWGDRIVGVSLLGAAVFSFFDPTSGTMVRVPLPRRSAYVMTGRARYDWQHGIFAEDIDESRVALTYRELTPELVATDLGREALAMAKLVVTPAHVPEVPSEVAC